MHISPVCHTNIHINLIFDSLFTPFPFGSPYQSRKLLGFRHVVYQYYLSAALENLQTRKIFKKINKKEEGIKRLRSQSIFRNNKRILWERILRRISSELKIVYRLFQKEGYFTEKHSRVTLADQYCI